MSTLDTPTPCHSSLSLPPSPPNRLPNRQDASLKSCFSNAQRKRYQPYAPRNENDLPGLLYAARSFGIMSPTDLTVDGVEESKDAFVDALSTMPDRILLSALDLKQADYERLALRVALSTAEIKYTERRQAFLSTMCDQNDGWHLVVSGACLDILDQVLGMRGLAEVQSNEQYHRDACAEELVALILAKSHVAQLHDLVGPQGSRWLGEDDRAEKVFPEEDAEEDSDDDDCDDKDNR